jgi:acyl-CoA dehydrogenase
MASFLWILCFIVVIGILFYHRISRYLGSLCVGILLVLQTWISGWTPGRAIEWIIFLAIVILIDVAFVRGLVAKALYPIIKSVRPKMSDTEAEALAAGSVGFEGELFSGKPNFNKLLSVPKTSLTQEEKDFLAGPVEEICAKIRDFDFTHYEAGIPDDIMDFLKSHGFFGMIIPKAYGGLGFSPYAHSQVIIKLGMLSVSMGTTVSVPNSLGPAELLLHYGTKEQKDYYLPRLANGREMPCFALTSLDAGSDAAAMQDSGVICKGKFEGEEVLGIRLNWSKRYITLAPIATVLGLAFKCYDPDGLLGDKKDLGITCALIPTSTSGLVHGRRHFPLNAAFPNGPTQGKDVFIPLDYVIGGKDMIGHGWRMLMECLAAGRAISLPSMVMGGVKKSVLSSGAYARCRRQFNTAIANFEGIKEVLAEMTAYLYMIESTRRMTLAALNQGEKPAVASGICKYFITEYAREIGKKGMDVHGGKGICLGPKNYLGRDYQEAPISITVEGANILTRSMIIFGQGAIRCHPFMRSFIEASIKTPQQVSALNQAIYGFTGHIISNTVRSLWLSLTGAHFVKTPRSKVSRDYQLLTRYSASFAFLVDMALVTLGGKLKFMEAISGRFADCLGLLYMGAGVLKNYHDAGEPASYLPVVQWIMAYIFVSLDKAMFDITRNVPGKLFGWFLRRITLPWGRRAQLAKDRLGFKIADSICNPSELRDYFAEDLYMTPTDNNPAALVCAHLQDFIDVEPLLSKAHKALRKANIQSMTFADSLEQACKLDAITEDEKQQILNTQVIRDACNSVDDFDTAELQSSPEK